MSANISSLVEEIQVSKTKLEHGDASSRQDLIWQCRKLISSLELPSEALQNMAYAEPAKFAHCRIAVEVGLFKCLAGKGEVGADVQMLAERSKVDPAILIRMMRHLAAMNVVLELGPNHFASTPFSLALADPKFEAGLKYLYDVSAPCHHAMPSYFDLTCFQQLACQQAESHPNSNSTLDGLFQYTHRTPLSFYSWLDASVGMHRPNFNFYMSAPRAGRLRWTDVASLVHGTLITGFDIKISPFSVVDVGGGLGHELIDLKTNFPSIPGELVLQDRPEVIDSLPNQDVFTPMVHDFFAPQPVHHARAYSLHSIMHDWSREQCVRILANVAAAMKRGYSKVLIADTIVPEVGASWLVTSFDWQMMALSGSAAHTQEEWVGMIEEAGLRVAKVHFLRHSIEHLIEAELSV